MRRPGRGRGRKAKCKHKWKESGWEGRNEKGREGGWIGMKKGKIKLSYVAKESNKVIRSDAWEIKIQKPHTHTHTPSKHIISVLYIYLQAFPLKFLNVIILCINRLLHLLTTKICLAWY